MSKVHMFKSVKGTVLKLSFDGEDFIRLNPLGIQVSEPWGEGYYQVSLSRGDVKYACREIIKCPSNLIADHKDRNSLNNCRDNLRLANHTQSMCNRKCHKNSKYSQFKGVTLRTDTKRSKPWAVKIKFGNILKIESFATEREAALQYNEWAKELHGEFAVLNDVE